MTHLVGITTWKRVFEDPEEPDTLHTLSTHYIESVAAAGMTPVLFPSSLPLSEAESLVGLVDGVIVSGGDDVDPAVYGEVNTASVKVSRAADEFEVAVIEAARRQGKPLLAICRGIQVLNVAMGGTLTQEVTSPGGVHDLIVSDLEEMDTRRHVVTFEPGLLSEMYGAGEAKVNTLHHQGVERLGDGLIVEGRSDDGLIEAARVEGDWWAVGVQWHPERLDGEHQRIFDALRDAIDAAAH